MARYSMAEAASRLGCSVDTVRRRIKAGKLQATKDAAGRWRVELPEPEGAAPEAAMGEGAHMLERRIADLEDERAALRNDLEELRRLFDQAQRLHAGTQQQLERLLPPPREPSESRSRPWWRFWG